MTDLDGVMYSHSGTFTASIRVPRGGVWTGTGETKCRAAEDLIKALAERLGKLCSPHQAAAETAAEQTGAQRIRELEAQVANLQRVHERAKDGLINDVKTQRARIVELQAQLSEARAVLYEVGTKASKAWAQG